MTQQAGTATDTTYNQDNWQNTQNPQANACCPHGNPFIEFSGHKWWTNYHWSPDHGTYVWGNGNMNSNFDPKQFYTSNADGSLTLKAFGTTAGKCITSEIVSADICGYGHYLVSARNDNGSFANLDPNVILGLFTYQWGEAPPADGYNLHRELDLLETISEQAQGRSGNAQFTLQPALQIPPPALLERLKIPSDCTHITALLHRSRSPQDVTFALYNGNYNFDELERKPAFAKWNPVSASPGQDIADFIPPHSSNSCERFHINLWLWKGQPPGSAQSITLTKFQYIPSS